MLLALVLVNHMSMLLNPVTFSPLTHLFLNADFVRKETLAVSQFPYFYYALKVCTNSMY